MAVTPRAAKIAGALQAANNLSDVASASTALANIVTSGSITSAMIADGTIVNGDISATAAIAGTKLAVPTISRTSRGITSGSVDTNTSSTWIAVTAGHTTGTAFGGATDLDLVISNLATGDWVELSVDAMWSNEASQAFLTYLSVNSSFLVCSGATATNAETPGIWYGQASVLTAVSGSFLYQIQSSDVSGGSATFRPYFRGASATSKTLLGTVASPMRFTGRRVAV